MGVDLNEPHDQTEAAVLQLITRYELATKDLERARQQMQESSVQREQAVRHLVGLGLTQREVGERLGLSQARISQMMGKKR
jgi:DNA-directed RNA polymerase specialized sigma subunit